jgi:hypothetical protein
VLLSFADLQEMGVIRAHSQLRKLIDHHGFPPGVWLSTRCHRWDQADILAWLKSRPAVQPDPLKATALVAPCQNHQGVPTRAQKRDASGFVRD